MLRSLQVLSVYCQVQECTLVLVFACVMLVHSSDQGWGAWALFKTTTSYWAGPSQSDKLVNSMEEGSASMQRYLSNSLSKVTTGVQGISGSVGSGISRWAFSLPHSFMLLVPPILTGLICAAFKCPLLLS